MNNILALDLGTKCGWAITSDDSIISGTEHLKIAGRNRFEGGGMRFVRFKKFLNELKNSNGVDEVYFEQVVARQPSVAADHAYGGYLACLTAWCEHHDIPYEGIPVGTIKKHITGKGNANKALVVEKIKEMGFDPCDDNEADALALLDLVTKMLG